MGDLAAHLLQQRESFRARLERAEKERDEAVRLLQEFHGSDTCLVCVENDDLTDACAVNRLLKRLSRVGAKP